MNTNDNTLSHHGVLGMKWGVRKSPETSKKTKNKRSGSKIPIGLGVATVAIILGAVGTMKIRDMQYDYSKGKKRADKILKDAHDFGWSMATIKDVTKEIPSSLGGSIKRSKMEQQGIKTVLRKSGIKF